MAVFKIEGGVRLKGEVIPQGAKNEALQILCAVLLTPESNHQQHSRHHRCQ
jgi:UDP-N-acetylglucosamine 1-carboxyvinyltransferase